MSKSEIRQVTSTPGLSETVVALAGLPKNRGKLLYVALKRDVSTRKFDIPVVVELIRDGSTNDFYN
jgi:hypothetical protein